MAHTRPLHAPPEPIGPTEGDGISYRGIVWFVVILTVTTLGCQLLVWGFLEFKLNSSAASDAPRAPLSAPATEMPPPPNVLYMGDPSNLGEPANLQKFRDHEKAALESYGWIDRNAGTVRIPIDRAKDLLIERGLPSAAPAAPVKKD